jgi:hypothetical protein
LLSHLSPTQTGWFESTSCIIVSVKNMIFSNLRHRQDIVWHWDLLIVIAIAYLIGNWRNLNFIRTSMDIIGIRGNNIISPRNFPFKMMASITFFINFLMTNHVPLHNRGGFKLWSKITGYLTFSCKLCGSMLDKSNEFNSYILILLKLFFLQYNWDGFM